MLTSFDISTSALVAQRTRLNVIAQNVANVSTTRNERGELAPYQERFVNFQTVGEDGSPYKSVRVSEVQVENAAPRMKYQPFHPDADENGYVAYPNINLTQQMVDAMEASRSYEANIGVIEVTKDLARQSLNILA